MSKFIFIDKLFLYINSYLIALSNYKPLLIIKILVVIRFYSLSFLCETQYYLDSVINSYNSYKLIRSTSEGMGPHHYI